MDGLRSGDLCIEVEESAQPPALRLLWSGKSNERQPDRMLGPFFAHALAQAQARALVLELHFQQLDHFNSSTVATVIQLIQQARAAGIRLALVFDPSRKWQKLSFEALAVFVKADGLFELRPQTPPAAATARAS